MIKHYKKNFGNLKSKILFQKIMMKKMNGSFVVVIVMKFKKKWNNKRMNVTIIMIVNEIGMKRNFIIQKKQKEIKIYLVITIILIEHF